MNADRDLAKLWLAKAQNDLLNADNNLRSTAIPYDTVCFHCQQAAEKILRVYFVSNLASPKLVGYKLASGISIGSIVG